VVVNINSIKDEEFVQDARVRARRCSRRAPRWPTRFFRRFWRRCDGRLHVHFSPDTKPEKYFIGSIKGAAVRPAPLMLDCFGPRCYFLKKVVTTVISTSTAVITFIGM
jgi:hypothetical protein